MAGKTKSMSQIKQMLQLFKSGKGIKTIVRLTGLARNTVKSYIVKLEKMPFSIDQLLVLDDPVLETHFHAGNPAYSDNRFEAIKQLMDGYIRELENPKNHLTRHALWQEYLSEHPNGYRYSQFCFHLNQHQTARNPSMVLSSVPAERLLVDFAGDTLCYVDINTGEIIQCQVFVACLQHTDYAFAIAVRSQSTEDFIYALACCLRQLGGVPSLLIPDNLKSAVITSNRYEPRINQVLQDMRNHYGFTVVPTRVKKPKDKALVENQVKLIYHRVYAKLRKQVFHSLGELNQAITEKVLDHNQTRMQQHPFTREERFLSIEQPCLKPLPDTVFQIKHYTELKVAKNNHIYLARDKHYYSVPYQWIGSKVKVIYTQTLVSIFAPHQEPIIHIRSLTQGGYTTLKGHLCSTHQHYLDRSPHYYIELAKGKTEVLGQLFERMFNQTSRPPEQLYRTCEGMLQLQRKTAHDIFEKACHLALGEEQYSYRFVSNVITRKTISDMTFQTTKPLPEHENILGSQYFKSQLEINF